LASPPLTTTARRFGSFRQYQADVADEYQAKKELAINERGRKLRLIEEQLASGSLPPELFDEVNSDEDKIRRYAIYTVASEFLDDSMLSDRLAIAKMADWRLRDSGLLGALQRHFASIAVGEVQAAALYNGVFDDIWPPDINHLKLLKIPEKVLAPRQLEFIA